MATSKVNLKFRSATANTNQDQISKKDKTVRGKLKRMDSVDFDTISNVTISQNNPAVQGPPPRSTILRRRDLSLEGRLRVNHFQHTHSASSPLAPGKKLLRFSDGALGRTGTALQAEMNQKVRSSSCLPLSKQRCSYSPRTSNLHLDRSCDGSKGSIDRQSTSPNRSQDRPESGTPRSRPESVGITKTKSAGRRLERFFSTDVSHSTPEPSTSGADASTSAAAATTSATDTRSRRSQFRRAISLFSLSCDKETDRERREKTSQKILRPPTRHTYRRGLSGLPIECTSRSIGVVY